MTPVPQKLPVDTTTRAVIACCNMMEVVAVVEGEGSSRGMVEKIVVNAPFSWFCGWAAYMGTNLKSDRLLLLLMLFPLDEEKKRSSFRVARSVVSRRICAKKG